MSMAKFAAEIGEARRVLQIMGEREPCMATRAGEERSKRRAPRSPSFAQRLQHLQDPAWRELLTFEAIEPDDLAGKTEIELDDAKLLALELERFHCRLATGTIHPVTCGRGSGDELSGVTAGFARPIRTCALRPKLSDSSPSTAALGLAANASLSSPSVRSRKWNCFR